MAYSLKNLDANVKNIAKTVDSHAEKLSKQEGLIIYFIVVVGVTLVATLVGLGGLYISAFDKDTEKSDLQEKMSVSVSTREFDQLKSDFLLLKAKNPYLK